jgi:hypothetical protein
MKTVLIILQLLPSLVAAMKALSELWPQSGVGPDKLALLEKVVKTSTDSLNDIWPVIEKVVALFVATDKEVSNKTSTDGKL